MLHYAILYRETQNRETLKLRLYKLFSPLVGNSYCLPCSTLRPLFSFEHRLTYYASQLSCLSSSILMTISAENNEPNLAVTISINESGPKVPETPVVSMKESLLRPWASSCLMNQVQKMSPTLAPHSSLAHNRPLHYDSTVKVHHFT